MTTAATAGRLELIHRVPAGPMRTTPILFVHGAFTAAWCWDEFFLPYFAARGFASLAVSLRGHGASHRPGSVHDHSIDDYVDDLASAAAALPAPPLLVGHSMGGFVAMRYLARYPAAGLVLVASVPPTGLAGPSLSLALWNPRLFQELSQLYGGGRVAVSAESLHQAIFSRGVPAEAVARYLPMMGLESMRAQMDMSAFAAGAPGLLDLGALAGLPVQVLGAAEDRLIPPAYVRSTARMLGVRADIFPEMAHGMMLEPGWEAVASRIHAWIEGQGL